MLNPPIAFAPFAGQTARRFGWALDRVGELVAVAALAALALLAASIPASIIVGRPEPTIAAALLASGCFAVGLICAVAERAITREEALR